MISAGEVTAPAGSYPPGTVVNNNAAPPPAPPGEAGAGPLSLSAPMSPLSAEQFQKIHAEDVKAWQGEQGANRNMQYANWGFQIGGQIVGAIAQGIMEDIRFDAWVTNTDRLATRDETIASYQKEVAIKTLDQLPELQREKNNLTRDLNRQHEAGQNERTRLALESQERIAAMRNLDSAFSLRSQYNYGNPFAA